MFKKKKTIHILSALLLSFALLQFFNQSLEKKLVKNKIEAPKEVLAILESSCFSCHSNEQNLSWLDKTAPISWAVNKDINRAREVMNFSEWDNTPNVHKGRMYAILNMIEKGKMPLSEYTLFHPSAKVLPQDVDVIRHYVKSLSAIPEGKRKDSEVLVALAKNNAETHISPNGVVYTDEFKSWKVISMTTLFDNSIRVVYGNDIAVEAIEKEVFHPWPDGSVVVKSVWKQERFANGEIRPGAFVNAQFMVKDADKYKETEGWGFAKFSGQNLKPTGKTAYFAQQSCISCHRQLAKETGFLFNVPMKVNNEKLIKYLQGK